MKPKPKPPPPTTTKQSHSLTSKATHAFKNRDGLGLYLLNPSTFPSSRVIYHNAAFVAIHDLYPKSTVHTLLLPRSQAHNLQHPFDAFQDAQFLSAVQVETAKLRDLVARELKRRLSAGSKSDQARAVAIKEGREGDVPNGRDWLAEVKVGIHAHPSMNHLHVHVFSRDMHSECLKHRKHFNSFNTPFLIDVADFPLREDDPRRHPGREGYLDRGLKCWRCGREFGNKFKALKEHLEVEFEEWKKE
jgi:aprataxin